MIVFRSGLAFIRGLLVLVLTGCCGSTVASCRKVFTCDCAFLGMVTAGCHASPLYGYQQPMCTYFSGTAVANGRTYCCSYGETERLNENNHHQWRADIEAFLRSENALKIALKEHPQAFSIRRTRAAMNQSDANETHLGRTR